MPDCEANSLEGTDKDQNGTLSGRQEKKEYGVVEIT